MNFNKDVLDFASPEDLKVVNSYKEQTAIMFALQRELEPLLAPFIHTAMDANTLSKLSSIFLDAIRAVSLDHPLLRMPFVEFNVKAVWSNLSGTVNFETENLPLRQILNAEYGDAYNYYEVNAKLNRLYNKARQQAEEEFYRTHYTFSHVVKADYPVSDSSMNAARLRESGLIPEGYEVLPVDVIDALIHAGLNAYDCAVGGKGVVEQLHHAATAAQNVLTRRKTRGAKIK